MINHISIHLKCKCTFSITIIIKKNSSNDKITLKIEKYWMILKENSSFFDAKTEKLINKT